MVHWTRAVIQTNRDRTLLARGTDLECSKKSEASPELYMVLLISIESHVVHCKNPLQGHLACYPAGSLRYCRGLHNKFSYWPGTSGGKRSRLDSYRTLITSRPASDSSVRLTKHPVIRLLVASFCIATTDPRATMFDPTTKLYEGLLRARMVSL